MSKGKKGNTWHFGIEMHIATDDCIGIGIGTNIVYGPADEYDIVQARDQISEEAEDVYSSDVGYICIEMREEFETDDNNPQRQYWIRKRPGETQDVFI